MIQSNPKSSTDSLTLTLFYNDPEIEVNLLDLEKITTARYKLLKEIELKHSLKKKLVDDSDLRLSLKQMQIQNKLWPQQKDQILNDQISHFILKLSVCNSNEESKWWIDMETLLFKYRCKEIDVNKLISPYIAFEQTRQIDFLHDIDRNVHPVSNDGVYYKVPLSLSASLLPKGYFPLRGKCYVTPKDLHIVVADIFRAGLVLASDASQKVKVDDERLDRIFRLIKDPDFDFGYKAPVNLRDIHASNIEELSRSHFPPCMKRLMTALKSEHHLKHNARLQFGLFLKGLGLPLEESLQFWRKMFSEKVNSEKFAKTYEYNIKHSYGRLGKMADYSPWSCNKITRLTSIPDGEYHGCPFRHSTKNELISILSTYPRLQPEVRDWILTKHQKEPQICCIRLFENTHPGIDSKLTEKVGIYPNAYFDASFEYK